MYTLSDRRGHLLSQILTVAHIADKIDEALMVGLAFREAYGAFGVECVCSIPVREDDDDDSPFWKRKDPSMSQNTDRCVFGLCRRCAEQVSSISQTLPRACSIRLFSRFRRMTTRGGRRTPVAK